MTVWPSFSTATRNITDGISIIKKHRQHLPLLQCFQFELRLHEVVGANYSAKIQFGHRHIRQALMIVHHVNSGEEKRRLYRETIKDLELSRPGINPMKKGQRTLPLFIKTQSQNSSVEPLNQIRLRCVGPVIRFIGNLRFRGHGLISPSRLRFAIPTRSGTGEFTDRGIHGSGDLAGQH